MPANVRPPCRFSRIVPGHTCLFLSLLLALTAISCGRTTASQPTEIEPGVAYQNDRITDVPWSVHIAKVDRSREDITFVSTHAKGTVLGLSTLSEQIKAIPSTAGRPLAGVNGDFYQREGSQYYGDPRGLQIVEGELFSAPNGGVSFWTDQNGHPHTTNVASSFTVTWPDGTMTTPFGLNEMRASSRAVLYTPTLGQATRTSGGRELVLESDGKGPWLPLRPGQTCRARVKEVRDSGNTPLRPDIMVLSLGPQLATSISKVEVGASLKLSTATFPDVTGARAAIGGGPMLVHNGKRMDIQRPAGVQISYEFRSMFERHPRAAVGWNTRSLFLIEVDGRQAGLSMGMTLADLSDYMVKLGCDEAMNLDGGGSATFWMNGKVRSSPCEGHERPLANALVLVRKDKPAERRTLRGLP